MRVQLGETKLEDWGFWDRVRIFFVQTRFAERSDNIVRYYKIYKHRKVLIREVEYREDY